MRIHTLFIDVLVISLAVVVVIEVVVVVIVIDGGDGRYDSQHIVDSGLPLLILEIHAIKTLVHTYLVHTYENIKTRSKLSPYVLSTYVRNIKTRSKPKYIRT